MLTPTIKDVARVAGVSVSTVSRVINEHPAVKPLTRQIVESAMRKLGFRPNQLARGLVGNKTYNIALAISSRMIQFYSDTSRAIHDEAIRLGYNLLLFHPDLTSGQLDVKARLERDPKSQNPSLRQLVTTLPVDGFILVLTDQDERLALELSRTRQPLVAVNRDLSNLGVDSVLADEAEGVFEAAEMLINLGHRRIGFIRGQQHNITCLMRFEGYRKALEREQLQQIVSGYDDLDEASGYRSMKSILEKEPLPTAVIAINDQSAMGAKKAISESGRLVPGDISLVGFDNRDFSAYLEPPLTTISKPKYEMGQEAVKLLFELISRNELAESHHTGKRVLLPTRLVVRESCCSIRNG